MLQLKLQIKERHFKVFDKAVKLVPLPPNFLLVFLPTAPGDKIAHSDNKLWLQLVNLFDSAGKNTRSHTAGSVSYNGKLKIIWVISERFFRPWFLRSR